MPTTTLQGEKLSTVELNWKEVFYTNCGMVSASNVDQELTWCRTDFAAIGVDYAYLLSRRENDWYPHYIHNLDNLIRFGGLYPPIHVEADIRRALPPVTVFTHLEPLGDPSALDDQELHRSDPP